MIYLITGAPGTGKTAKALTILKSLPQYPDRVIVAGVKDYKGGGVYFEKLTGIDEFTEFPFESYPGYCFLIDECQDYWPSRVAGRNAPDSLTFLPKHRHIGQDYILTCQFATQLDVKLRHLVGRHIHLQKEALGVFEYEAGHCVEKVSEFLPTSKRPRGGLDKETFKLYTSMEGEETALQKSKPRLPFKLWLILGLIVVLFSALAYFLFGRENMFTQFMPDDEQQTTTQQKPGEFDPLKNLKQDEAGKKAKPIKNLREIKHPLELAPKNSDYPELADQPRLPVSCVANTNRCLCFDQVGHRIDRMSQDRCRTIISGADAMVAAWGRIDTPKFDLYEKREKEIKPLEEKKDLIKPEELNREKRNIEPSGVITLEHDNPLSVDQNRLQ